MLIVKTVKHYVLAVSADKIGMTAKNQHQKHSKLVICCKVTRNEIIKKTTTMLQLRKTMSKQKRLLRELHS